MRGGARQTPHSVATIHRRHYQGTSRFSSPLGGLTSPLQYDALLHSDHERHCSLRAQSSRRHGCHVFSLFLVTSRGDARGRPSSDNLRWSKGKSNHLSSITVADDWPDRRLWLAGIGWRRFVVGSQRFPEGAPPLEAMGWSIVRYRRGGG